MVDMTQLKRRKAVNGLKKKEFREMPNKKNDLWLGLTIDGKFVPEIATFVSRGGKKAEIYENNIQNMVRELHMDNKRQFLDYIDCSYTYEAYLNNLREKQII